MPAPLIPIGDDGFCAGDEHDCADYCGPDVRSCEGCPHYFKSVKQFKQTELNIDEYEL